MANNKKSPEWLGLNKKIRWGRAQVPALADEVTWEIMLQGVGGSSSLGDMNIHNMARVVDHMAREFGIKFSSGSKTGKYKAKAAQRRSDFYEIPDGPQAPLKRKICAMWRELGYDLLSLEERVKRQFRVPTLLWLHDARSLHILLSDLQAREKRQRKKEGEIIMERTANN